MHEIYCDEDYLKAEELGLDLDNWNDYQKFFGLEEDCEEI